MKSQTIIFFLSWFFLSPVYSQTISTSVPAEIKKSEKYLFYQHGGVVTVHGNNGITAAVPEWGTYEYLNILDSLKKRGFNVISERRFQYITDSTYIIKVSNQIDTLLKAGVKAKNIIVVGASAGWNITLGVSAKLKNKKINYVIMGGCWPNDYKQYLDLKLYGRFLSIIETTDPHGTCFKIFEGRKLKGYKEIKLNMGLSHGFIYKGFKEWIDPIVSWLITTN